MENTPIHGLAQMVPGDTENTLADCLNSAYEEIGIAMGYESRGDIEQMKMWLKSAQNWLDEAERRAK